jgi:hypothetical protein
MSPRQNNILEPMTLVDLHELKIALVVIALEKVGFVVHRRLMLFSDVGETSRIT